MSQKKISMNQTPGTPEICSILTRPLHNFCAAGTNGRPDFNLSSQASSGLIKWLCTILVRVRDTTVGEKHSNENGEETPFYF